MKLMSAVAFGLASAALCVSLGALAASVETDGTPEGDVAAGRAMAERLRSASLALYEAGRAHAAGKGIIIADTKFEFGTTADGSLLVIDEILTPDSSRFWPAARYTPGRTQPSFDKQPLRDYLAGIKKQGGWNGEPPPPTLPDDVVQATSARYRDAFRLITGYALPDA